MVDDIPREPNHSLHLAGILSLLVAGTGLIALLGWGLQLPFLTGFGAGRIPMAPSTALLFVLYGIALFLRPGVTWSLGAYRASVVSVISGMLAALLLFFLSILGIHPPLEHLGFPIPGTSGGAPIGHMSPVAAVCFLVAGLSFLALPPTAAERPRRAKAALYLASLLVAVSLVLLLAYLFGTPLFSTGTFIPPALNTSIAFLFLGITLLGIALSQSPFLRREEEVTRTEYLLLLVFLLLAAGIVTAGYFYQLNYERRYRHGVESQLSAISQLKVGDLMQYRKERLDAAAVFFRNASFSGMVRRFLEHPEDAGARRRLHDWIGNYGTQFESSRVFLLDTRGDTRLSVPETPHPPDVTISRRASEIARSGQVGFQDFYRNEYNRKIFLAVLIPVLERTGRRAAPGDSRSSNRSRRNPFFPSSRHWPTPSRTAETVLVRRDGNDVLFLNGLRDDGKSALSAACPPGPEFGVAGGEGGAREEGDRRGAGHSREAGVGRCARSTGFAVVRGRPNGSLGSLRTGAGAALADGVPCLRHAHCRRHRCRSRLAAAAGPFLQAK